MRYVIGLGTNLGDKEENLKKVLVQIASLGRILACSRFHTTKALLHPDKLNPQPDYLNGVVLLESNIEPENLLSRLLEIESSLGRIRGMTDKPWEARVIDLDIIFCDDLVLSTPRLKIPHPEMHKRDFVLLPLLEIAPDWMHPVLGKKVREIKPK